MSVCSILEAGPTNVGGSPNRRFISARIQWVIWLIVVAGVCAAHVRHPDGTFGHGTYILITVAAAVVAWIGVVRQPPRLRFAWICVAVGVTCSGIGDTIYYIMGLLNGNLANISIADAFWLVAYVGLAVGVSSLIVGGFGRRRVDIDGLLDIGSFAVLAVVIVTQFAVVHDIVTDTSYSVSTRIIWTAYPVLDAALLGVVTQAMFSKRLRNLSGVFLGVGAGLWLISDFTSLLIGSSESLLEMVGPRVDGRGRLPRCLGVAAKQIRAHERNDAGREASDQQSRLHHPAAASRSRQRSSCGRCITTRTRTP